MRELSLAFGPGDELLGTVCLPDRLADAAPGVLLFNAGMLHRIGPHRVQVKLARNLAERGVASLRFDMHGLGDSARASGQLPLAAQMQEDLRAALDALGREAGVDTFAVFGFCSGIEPSFRLAQADARVRVLALYDGFDLMNGLSRIRYYLRRLRQHGVGRVGWAHYARRARLLWGELLVRLRDRDGQALDAADEALSVTRLLQGMGRLAADGARVTLIHAGSAFGVRDGQAQMRAALDRHGARQVHAVFLDQVDHLVTSSAAQQAFIAAVGDALAPSV